MALDQVKFTSKEILAEQMKDDDILEMLAYLQSGKEITAENFPPGVSSICAETDGLSLIHLFNSFVHKQ